MASSGAPASKTLCADRNLTNEVGSELLQSERSYLDALLQLGQLVLTPLEKALRDANPTTATVIQRLLNLHRIIYSSQKRSPTFVPTVRHTISNGVQVLLCGSRPIVPVVPSRHADGAR